jgi:hypothetical protein
LLNLCEGVEHMDTELMRDVMSLITTTLPINRAPEHEDLALSMGRTTIIRIHCSMTKKITLICIPCFSDCIYCDILKNHFQESGVIGR